MGELRQIHKFSNVSRSIEILTELAKLGATKYNTFAISRVAKTFGVDRALVRSNAERNELLLEFVHGLMNENALLKVENEALKEHEARINGFYRQTAAIGNPIIAVKLEQFPLESLENMQALGLLQILD